MCWTRNSLPYVSVKQLCLVEPRGLNQGRLTYARLASAEVTLTVLLTVIQPAPLSEPCESKMMLL
jgi:hypothetical protein